MKGWWILGATGGAAIIGAFLYWQLIIAEGVYLGQKIVTLLYDRVAHKYNNIKAFDKNDEHFFLGLPLQRALGHNYRGIVLDVATGTGRLPLVMSRLPTFQGRVMGVDHSARMLAVARRTMPKLPLVMANATRLPFAHNSVGAVTCLEALEFFPSPQQGVQELARVLSPGGVLLATNRVGWEAKLMPGKTWTTAQVKTIFAQASLTNVMVKPWLDIYDQVWATKL